MSYSPLAAALIVIAALAAPAAACTVPRQVETIRGEVIAGLNAQRRNAGLQPLSPNDRLTRAAQDHACDSADSGRMSHVGSDGSKLSPRIKRTGYSFRAGAENVGFGFRGPSSAVSWWMQSPPHRANILLRQATEVGVGTATGPDGKPHWVMIVARPK